MMRTTFVAICILVFLGGINLPVSAGTTHPPEVLEVVKPYVKAFRAYDKPQIMEAHEQINADTEVLSYITDNMPEIHRLYNAWNLVLRVEALNARYGNNDIRLDYNPENTVTEDSTVGRSYPSNSRITRELRNQSLPSNQSRVTSASINSNRISNSRIMRSYSNDKRISNRERIRSTLRRR